MKRSITQNTEPREFFREQHNGTATSVHTIHHLPYSYWHPRRQTACQQPARTGVQSMTRPSRQHSLLNVLLLPRRHILHEHVMLNRRHIRDIEEHHPASSADRVPASSFSSPASTPPAPLLLLHGITAIVDLGGNSPATSYSTSWLLARRPVGAACPPCQHRLQATTRYRRPVATLPAYAGTARFQPFPRRACPAASTVFLRLPTPGYARFAALRPPRRPQRPDSRRPRPRCRSGLLSGVCGVYAAGREDREQVIETHGWQRAAIS